MDASLSFRQLWPNLHSTRLAGAVLGRQLHGGLANHVWRATLRDGTHCVVKTAEDSPPGLFAVEAEGLVALHLHGGLDTPDVLEVGPGHLVLTECEPAPDDRDFWESAGRAVARLHSVRGPRYGWHRDGWLGRLTQYNPWTDDGYSFFAEHRVLRYLSEPKVELALDATDRARLERLCRRLPEYVPLSEPVLTHGDLWHGNLLATAEGEPVFIDPAVCWMWVEADLSMAYCTGGVPEAFFAAYQEIRPLADGWQERMSLLHIRELLSVLAHFGPVRDRVDDIRHILSAYA